MERKHKVEIAAATIMTAAVAGGIAVRYAKNARLRYKYKEPDPSILNEQRLGATKLERINLIAAYIIIKDRPERADIARDFDYSMHNVSDLVGHLIDRNLVVHDYAEDEIRGLVQYYAPTEALLEAANDSMTNNRLSAAVEFAYERFGGPVAPLE